MRIVILGAPGSGKRTQAKLLAARYRVLCITVDDLLRAAVAGDGRLDAGTRAAAEAGEPVADDVLVGLLEERLRARDSKRGFIIDDFPCNIPQAQALDARLGILGGGLHIAVHVTVGDETLVRRISGRLQCGACDAVYNRHTAPPATRGKCDQCGGRVASANRDDARSAAHKIEAHHAQFTPLLAYYKAQHKLRTVAGEGEIEEIRQKICDIIDLEIRPLEIKTLETAAQSNDEEVSTVIAGGQISRITTAPDAPARSAPPAQSADAKMPPARKPRPAAGKKKPASDGKQAAKKTTAKPAAKKIAKKAARKPASSHTVKKVAKKTTKKSTPNTVKKATENPAKIATKNK